MTLRAWLYRVAHNRCIDHLRRPLPPAAEIYELSRTPTHDPQAETARREDLRRLVQDVQRLPEQQRSALLMRELDGLTYAELADALDTSVPAIKSLLVRARVGPRRGRARRATPPAWTSAPTSSAPTGAACAPAGARAGTCATATAAASTARRLRGVDEGLAALVPGGAGPLATVAKLLGIGGASSGAAAPAPEPAARPPWPAAPRPPRPPRRRSSRSSAAPPSSAEARPRCASTSARRRPPRHAAAPRAHGRGAPGRRGRARQGAGGARDRPGARRRAAGADAAQGPRPRAGRHARQPPPTDPGDRQRRGARAGRRWHASAPEEAQTGGAMAPDEDAMPGPERDRSRRRSLARRPGRGARADERRRRRRRPPRRARTPAAPVDAGAPIAGADAGRLTAFGRTGAIVAPRDGALPDQARARAAARPARDPLGALLHRRGALDRPRPGPGRLPDVALRRQPRRRCATRCACRGR